MASEKKDENETSPAEEIKNEADDGFAEDTPLENTAEEIKSAEEKNHVGGFFDSLIADFSLDSLPETQHIDDSSESDEPVVETVDGITVESTAFDYDSVDTDSVTLFDENDDGVSDENNEETDTVPENTDEKHYGFFRSLFPIKGDSVFEIIRKIIFLIAVITFITAGILLILNLTQSEQAVKDQEKDEEIIVTTVATTINEKGEVVTVKPTEEEILTHNFSVMEYYKGINPEIIGFLELEGCGIAQPVTQGEDNDYYLKHTYYNASNQAGSVFADYRCVVTEDYTSPNIVLYGHNQRDGTMFGQLKKYKSNVDFYADNPFVTFNTEYSSEKYVIFGFFITNTLERQDSNGEVFHYQDYIETLSDERTYNWYLAEIAERNQIIPPVDVRFGDRLLVLSTCSNEYADSRFVVFARLLREDETEESFDFSTATLNPAAKSIDWNAIFSVRTAPRTSATTTEPETTTTTTVSEKSETEKETTKKKKSKKKKKTTTEKTSEEKITETVSAETSPPETEEEISETVVTTTETTTETTVETTTETTTVTTTTTPHTTSYTGYIPTPPPTYSETSADTGSSDSGQASSETVQNSSGSEQGSSESAQSGSDSGQASSDSAQSGNEVQSDVSAS